MSHFVTHPGTPPKVRHTSRPPFIFSRPSTKHSDKYPLYKFSLNCSREFLSGGVCQWVFSLEGFVRGGFCPFRLLSEYICYNRKLNITLNFRFHMYDKKNYKCDVTDSRPPPLCHKLSHHLGPPPPSSVTYFMDGPLHASSLREAHRILVITPVTIIIRIGFTIIIAYATQHSHPYNKLMERTIVIIVIGGS